MSDLRTGKWVREEKGIPTDKLIVACNSGKLTAYFPDSEQKILASTQCRKKFLFHDWLYFSLVPINKTALIAINEQDADNFVIHFGRIKYFSKKDDVSSTNEVIDAPDTNKKSNETTPIIRSHELYRHRQDNENYLFFFKSKCNISESCDIFRYINYLYPLREIIFEPKREGMFRLRLLVLEPNQQKGEIRNVSLSVTEIGYENDSKLILEDYNDNYISIYYNNLQCIDCKISPFRDKYYQKNVFSMPYKKCYRDFHQYKLNYYKQDDEKFKKPLQLKKDFFIFDYKEYCQQGFLQENEESKRAFYEYIEGLFFDINELENIFIDDFEDDEILEDPLAYMKKKCIFLLNKYIGDKYEEIIRLYYEVITTNKKHTELHDKFFPLRRGIDKEGKNRYVSQCLGRFKTIALKNNIPYIQASKFKEITQYEVREEIRKSMKNQLDNFRAKKDKLGRDRR